MKGYLTKLDEKVKQRIKLLLENDAIVEENEEKIKEIERLVNENERIIKGNHEKIKNNKTQIVANKRQLDICYIGDTKNLSESIKSNDALSLASEILQLTENNLELCKDNLQRTIEDRDRIVEIQDMCLSSTTRNKQSLVILQENISEMMGIARVLLCLTEDDDDEFGEDFFEKNGLMKQRRQEVKLWRGSDSKWKWNLINLLQLLFDKREKVFDYKNDQSDDRTESMKRKLDSPRMTINKKPKLLGPTDSLEGCARLVWRVDGIEARLRAAATGGESFVLSDPFTSHSGGYRLCLCVHLAGYGDGWGTHLSVSYHFMRGPADGELQWPFAGTVKVVLVDQARSTECCVRHYNEASVPAGVRFVHQRPSGVRAVGWADSTLVALDQLTAGSPLMADGSLHIRCYVCL